MLVKELLNADGGLQNMRFNSNFHQLKRDPKQNCEFTFWQKIQVNRK